MKKQKICIIGGGLAGLATAISLSKLNCQIDLITGSEKQNRESSRTIAISQNNFNFLNKLNIAKSFTKETWPCSIMKLYTEGKNENFSEIFEFNNDRKREKILYIIKNSKIKKLMINKIKQIKSILLNKNKKISEIGNVGLLKSVKLGNNNNKYNLIIICTGKNSSLVKNFFKEKIIENSYKEVSIITILKHNPIKNNIARQFFLNNEILALLPISNTKTSIVWSVKKDMKKKDELYLKNKIKFYVKNYLKNITFLTKLEYKDLNFSVRNKYFQDRILLLGDALHEVHPFVGQGFNMILRDLMCLERILDKKISLGLDIGSTDILSEFSEETKPRNFVFSLGVDFLKNSFSYKKLRNNTLKIFNKNNFAKNIFFDVADKGFRF